MPQLPHKTSMHDVEDIEGFVNATLNAWQRRSGIGLSPEHREELVGEGIAIMAKLAADYEPHREGYEQEGRFSGFAAQFLPRRLTDAWHRLNQHHEFRTQPDGRRKWEYNQEAVSLEAMLSKDGDDEHRGPSPHDQPALRVIDEQTIDDGGFRDRLRPALTDHAMREVEVAIEVGALLGTGMPPSDVCAELGIRPSEFHAAVERIKQVAHRLTNEEAA